MLKRVEKKEVGLLGFNVRNKGGFPKDSFYLVDNILLQCSPEYCPQIFLERFDFLLFYRFPLAPWYPGGKKNKKTDSA